MRPLTEFCRRVFEEREMDYPTPWVGTLQRVSAAMCIDDADGRRVAIVPAEVGSRIVAAVNAHDGLLAACELLVNGDGQPDECRRAMQSARAAIAKARP